MTRFPSVLTHPTHGPMALEPSRLLLAFKQAQADLESLRNKLSVFGLALEESDSEGQSRPLQDVNHTDRRFWVRIEGDLDDERLTLIETALAADLAWVGPVYRLPQIGGDPRARCRTCCSRRCVSPAMRAGRRSR
jgi:hypothetical protein